MILRDSRVLITGAAGGIGWAMVERLVAEGAHVLAVDRDTRALVGANRARVEPFIADLASAGERSGLCAVAREWRGGIDVLINNAGLNPFGLNVNLHAPMHLCRELIPHLRKRPQAAIVNMGSVFGSIGYPGYAAYAATKFAMRGFTEALRRELSGSSIEVKYLAPRATRTPINSTLVENMNRELGVAMDPPERVAGELVALLGGASHSAVVGWPEKLFVRINALWPAVVDRAIRAQLPIIQRHARASVAPIKGAI
jgi:short-subunit dehydrogenase